MLKREFPEAPIVGVGAVVLEGKRVLLVRRGQPPRQGEWSIPGGVLELGETLEDGVRREVYEETGLNVAVICLVEVLDRIVPASTAGRDVAVPATHRCRYHYVLVDFLCVVLGGTLQSASDAEDAQWVEGKDLAAYCLATDTIAVIEKAFRLRDQDRE